jgi:hypothetical protein
MTAFVFTPLAACDLNEIGTIWKSCAVGKGRIVGKKLKGHGFRVRAL